MKAVHSFQLSPSQSSKLWHRCLAYLYVPVVLSAMTHLFVYPALILALFVWCMRAPALRMILQDRAMARLLLGFVTMSFAFLCVWVYVQFEPARTLVGACYVVCAVMLGRQMETLSRKVWLGSRTSYHV